MKLLRNEFPDVEIVIVPGNTPKFWWKNWHGSDAMCFEINNVPKFKGGARLSSVRVSSLWKAEGPGGDSVLKKSSGEDLIYKFSGQTGLPVDLLTERRVLKDWKSCRCKKPKLANLVMENVAMDPLPYCLKCRKIVGKRRFSE